MHLRNKKILVTGGAGFIGSHLVDSLSNSNEITIFDNLSSGKIEKIKHNLEKENVKFIKGDLKKRRDLIKIIDDYDVVFHLAANPEVKVEELKIHFQENVYATYNLIEMLKRNVPKMVVFASTSTVYGEAEKIPTPEDYGPLKPISSYAAAKLACESMFSAFSNYHESKVVVLRLANVVGKRMERGVIKDFIDKLKLNPKRLEILGNGLQEKSYIHVEDCINGILTATEKSKNKFDVFNIGSEDRLKVIDIAKIVLEEMGIKNTEFVFIDKFKDGRGWRGDVKLMQLSIEKLKKLGWKPKYNSKQSIRKAVKELKGEI
jgi:UDP-glucose 4-epimerase